MPTLTAVAANKCLLISLSRTLWPTNDANNMTQLLELSGFLAASWSVGRPNTGQQHIYGNRNDNDLRAHTCHWPVVSLSRCHKQTQFVYDTNTLTQAGVLVLVFVLVFVSERAGEGEKEARFLQLNEIISSSSFFLEKPPPVR